MLTVVIDTNCLLQIIPKQAPNRWLYDMLLQGKISLAVSSDILLEYHEILEQKTNNIVASNVVRTLVELPDTKNASVIL